MNKRSRLIMLLILMLIITAAAVPFKAEALKPIAPAWPMFRHDPLHTGFIVSGAPVTGNVLWEVQVGLPIYASPAVVSGKVFLGVRDQALALDEQTGATLWKAPMVGEIYSSPAVDLNAGKAGLVYFASYGSKSSTLSALDINTGSVCWWIWVSTKSSPTVVTNPPGMVCNSIFPPVPRATVYIGSGPTLIAVDADTGQILWTFYGEGVIDSTPAVDEQNVYFGTNANLVYAVNRYTGTGVWKFAAKEAGAVVAAPSVSDQWVVFGSTNGLVYCLDKMGGLLWTYRTPGPIISSPAYYSGAIYIGANDGAIGSLYKLDTDGKLIWRVPLPGDVYSSPAVAAQIIYNPIQPAMTRGKIYIGSSGSRSSAIFCFDEVTGQQLWFKWMMVESSPAVADGMLFVTSTGGSVYAFMDRE